MPDLFKHSENPLDGAVMMIAHRPYMVDGFIEICPYGNMSVAEYKVVTHAKEVRNCDVELRLRDYIAEPVKDKTLLVLRFAGNTKVPTAMEAAMRRAMK